MAGAVEQRDAAPAAAAPGRDATGPRWRPPPPVLALGMAAAALLVHALLWGTQAPLGSATTCLRTPPGAIGNSAISSLPTALLF